MSREYVGEYYAASDRARLPPYTTTTEDSLTESLALGNAFIELFGSAEQKNKLLA